MGLPVINKKKFKKKISCKKISKLIQKIQNFITFQGLIFEINLVTLGSLKIYKIGPLVTFYVLKNNFSYIQLAFTFVPQKGSCYVHDDNDA